MGISLQKKMILQVCSICFILISVYAFSTIRQAEVASAYRNISSNQFPKVESASRMIASFRQIRIKVRTLGLIGNSEKVQKKYIKETKEAISKFLKEKKHFEEMSFTENEKMYVEKLDRHWGEFLAFGASLLGKYESPTPSSVAEGAEMIRDICPVKAKKWMSIAESFLEYQSKRTREVVRETVSQEKMVSSIGLFLIIVSAAISLFIGFYFSRKITKSIRGITERLLVNTESVDASSTKISTSSTQLSDTSSRASSSLQQTVAAIDEISSMVQRNADAANSSTQISTKSSSAADKGKETVELMIHSINEISVSNQQIADEMEKTNQDLSRVVQVISEIGEKTKVINDIVFQTKLLSFNASVEAARAGEHGKGFAVVAEEVGNLAAMSGKAALEITDMLDKSTKQVSEIVDNSKKKVESLISTSKNKIQTGTDTAQRCGDSLDEILQNVNAVNEMVKEIATASSEQSTGVQEVTRSIQQFDQITHQNSSVAQDSSLMSRELKQQASGLGNVVDELMTIILGVGKAAVHDEKTQVEDGGNVLELKMPDEKALDTTSGIEKKVSGLDTSVPTSDDPRFKDL